MSRESKITRFDFKGHAFSDQCPQRNLTYSDILDPKKIFLIKDIKRMREIRYEALIELRRFILAGGAQADSLAEFLHPSQFDPNSYNSGTIVRIHSDFYMRTNFKSIIDGQYVDDCLSLEDTSLGIVCALPRKNKPKFLLCFYGEEQEIVLAKPTCHRMYDNPIVVGDWIHQKIYANLFPIIDDLERDEFYRPDKIEVLAIGKSVPVKSTERSALSSLRLSVSQVTR